MASKDKFRKGSEKVRKSEEGWRRECVGCGERARQQILPFFTSYYSLLNETTQFNCPEFMGPTIGEDAVSGVLWRKRLPDGPTFVLSCYYRCGNS